MQTLAKILWIDDEIESLKSQVIFLEQKGYSITTISNGFDAIDFLKTNPIDLVLLDESMPGITGLETLQKIKEFLPSMPIVMVTKNEAENIMEDAIGSQISDYLIKPVNPNQVLLSLKKILENKRLVAEKTTSLYQQDFRNLFMALNSNPNHKEWMDIYKKLIFWELGISKSNSPEMQEVLQSQKTEANSEFGKFISKNYAKWFLPNADSPLLSHNIVAQKLIPILEKDVPVFFILVDNLRFDQWKTIQPIIDEYFHLTDESSYYSILPTATQYCRNAIFAGLMPAQIEKKYPNNWKNDDEEGGKNLHEEFFFKEQLKTLGKQNLKTSYTKITNHHDGQILETNIHNLLQNDLNVIVYNFVDMLSHARTEMEVLKELANDETSYRSLTKSWFQHSPLLAALKRIAGKKVKIVITTDHGSIRVNNPLKVIGDKQTTANLRYKHGRNLNYDAKGILAFKEPKEIYLPSPTINSSFIFAKEDAFLCYPNNFNYYVNFYKNTFQHGGVSLEEIIVPFITLQSK